MKKNPIETILGFLVLILACLFLFFACSRIDTKDISGYTVIANFAKVGGLGAGADVRIPVVQLLQHAGNAPVGRLDQLYQAAAGG